MAAKYRSDRTEPSRRVLIKHSQPLYSAEHKRLRKLDRIKQPLYIRSEGQTFDESAVYSPSGKTRIA